MKKKLIALVLALSACFSMTACDVVKDKLSGLPIIGGLINKDSSTEDPAEEYDLDGAKKLLESRVKTTNAESREEYAVPASFQLLGVTYTVEWSVDVDTVKIEKDGDEVYVNVYEASLLLEDTPFVLTAKITAPDGTSIETKMNRIVPKLERYVPAKITEKPVEGTAYKFNVYQAKNKNEVYVNGKMKNTYYFDTSKEYGQGIDIYVEYAEGSTTDFYLYHNVGEGEAVEKVYINVVKNGSHINAIYGNPNENYEGTLKTPFYFHDEWKTIATDLNDSTYYLGCDGTYNTVEPQNGTGPDYFMGYLVEEVDRLTVEDEDKLAHEVTTLTLAPAYLAGGESASVVTHGSRYPDVKISWEANSEAVSLKRTVLSFNDTDTSASVTLTATLTIGDKTETKDVSFTVVPNTTEDILAAAAAFNSGEAFGNKVELTGVIVSIDDEYDPTYDNVTFTMLVGDKKVEGYHMKGDGADVLAPGFTVTCSGKFMNYGGKLEFSSGRIESYEVGEAPELPEAPTGAEAILNALYALQDGETMTGEFTLTGKITALDNYNNPTIVVEGFENMPVYCYRLSVENKVGDTITVTAKTMKNYGGKYEFMDCTLVSSGNEGGNEGETTSGVTIAAIADANNWTDATVAASFTYGDFTVTVSAEKPNATYGQNTGKYYENGENWRMYQNEVPSIVVSAAEGKYITSVKITYASEKTGVLLYGDTQIASDAVVTASASSITFGVGNTGDATNGQVRITAIDVICADGEGTGTVTPPAGGDNEGESTLTSAEQILNALYALADGESLTGPFTLTGKITALDNFSNPTIVVEGFEDKPVYCYMLKVTNAVGDVITVQAGSMKNYMGTYEFMNCTLVASGNEGGNEDEEAITDAEQILTSLYALADGESLTGPFILTGTITALDSYNNPTITVKGFEDKPVYCYRLVVSNVVGDVITVKAASMKNYMGTYEFMNCTLVTDAEGGEGEGETPVPPTGGDNEGEGETTLTPAEIVEQAYALTDSATLNATLTGVISKVDTAYSSEHSNVTVTIIVEDLITKPIMCYRMKGTGADTIGVGDIITVTGTIKNYYGTIEFDTGCTFVLAEDTTVPAATKLFIEANEIDLPTSVSEAGNITVPTIGELYQDVTIAWNTNSNFVVVAGDNLTVTMPNETTVVKLTATLSCNGIEQVAEFTLTLSVVSESASWKMVTDLSQLKAGAKIVIAALASDVNYAIGDNQKTSNRGASAITKTDDSISFDDANIEVLTLVAGTKDGTFAFQTEEGTYLYAASSSSNHLKSSTSLDDNGSWAITIAADGTATVVSQGSNTRNTMQYNPNNGSPLFSCYASDKPQKPICIYIYA